MDIRLVMDVIKEKDIAGARKILMRDIEEDK